MLLPLESAIFDKIPVWSQANHRAVGGLLCKDRKLGLIDD